MRSTILPTLFAICLLPLHATKSAAKDKTLNDDRYDQSSVSLEVEPNAPGLVKIVLVAGKASHGPGDHEFFAGSVVLMNLLKQTPGVFPVLVRDGWPKNEGVFAGASSIVFFLDGSGDHPMMDPAKRAVIFRETQKGAGYVNLHYALEYTPEVGREVLPLIGGYYEPGVSINPRWSATFKSIPTHPVTQGVTPFRLHDEWYYNMTWVPEAKGVTPILVARPPDPTRETPDTQKHMGRDETVAWTFERADGGRGFGFTGGHIHANWGIEPFRRTVVNGILWSAKVEIPATGAPVNLDPAELDRHLDRKERGPKPIPQEYRVEAPSRPITDWMFAGPFNFKNNTGFDAVYPPEKSETRWTLKDPAWRRIETDPAGTVSSYVLMRDKHENSASYFFTKIHAPRDQPINLGIGSDDGVKVWLNEQLIHANDIGRGLTQDEDAAWGNLKKGENTLLVKLINGGGLGGLVVTMKSKDVTVSAEEK